MVLACSIIALTTPTLIGSCLGTVRRLPSECFNCLTPLNVQCLDFKNKYGLGPASEGLMHVMPSQIESVIGKLADMSSRHVIDIDWFEEKLPRNVAPHNFIHQYEKIYRQFRQVKEIVRIPITRKGLVFNGRYEAIDISCQNKILICSQGVRCLELYP